MDTATRPQAVHTARTGDRGPVWPRVLARTCWGLAGWTRTHGRASPGCWPCVRRVLRHAWDRAQSSYSLKGRPSLDRRSCRETPCGGGRGEEPHSACGHLRGMHGGRRQGKDHLRHAGSAPRSALLAGRAGRVPTSALQVLAVHVEKPAPVHGRWEHKTVQRRGKQHRGSSKNQTQDYHLTQQFPLKAGS